MSIIDDDELEEVEEEETEKENPVPTTLDEDDEQEEEEVKRKDNFVEINAKRKLNKKATALRFLLTFALNNKKPLETVAKHIGITGATGRKYLSEYVAIVIYALENGTYPDSVLQSYNSDEIPIAQRLKISHMEALRPVIIRYHDTNIESLMRQMGHGEIIEEEEQEQVVQSDPEEELLDDYVQQGGKFKEFNEVKQQKRNVNVNIRALTNNSPIQDIIRFGIHNCGQPDDAKIRKVIAVFMNAPAYYLSDESVFVNLLEANNINAKTVTAFMNWFKHVAPISPQQRQGFLNLNAPLPQQQGGQNQQQKAAYNNFDINDYDEFAQYLYHEGVYKYGLAPNHPINVQAYQEYLEEKKQEKIEKQNNRQFNNALKQRVLEMQSNRFMGGGAPQQGGQMPNQGIALDEKFLLDRGMVAPEITYDMYGNKTVRLIPTGKTPTDVYGGATNPSKPDQFLESVSVVTRLIEALKPALNMGGGSTNPLMDKFMEAAIGKLINKAEESPTQVLDRELSLFDKLQKVFPQNGGGNRPKTDLELQTEIRLKEIENDKFFAGEELKIKKEDMEMKKQMMAKQEEESKNGIEMILGWLGKGFEMVSPILNSVLAGNMGGGIGNILGGMMPGGGGGGGMMGGPPPQQPFIPPQPQTEFEVVEPSSGFVPPPTAVPQDFLPQQSPPEYTPQQPYEQPPPVYEQQPYQPTEQYNAPYNQQYEEPPQQQDDFLDSIAPEDLEGLSVGQLDEITNRIESKASKIEKLLNSIKTTKVRKQFGYNKPLKKTIKKTTFTSQNEDYSLLDISPNMNPDYDGISGSRELVEEFVEVPDAQPVFTDAQPTFLNYDANILDMGNDNQQFNQQNDANQPEYIAKISAQQKADNLRAENERRKAKGQAPLPDGTVVDETGRVMSEEAVRAADNKVENSDEFNDNPGLNESESASSDEFNKAHKGKQSDKKQYDAQDANKEKEKKGTADDNTTIIGKKSTNDNTSTVHNKKK